MRYWRAGFVGTHCCYCLMKAYVLWQSCAVFGRLEKCDRIALIYTYTLIYVDLSAIYVFRLGLLHR